MAGRAVVDGIQRLGLLDDGAIALDEAALRLAAPDHDNADLAPARAWLAGLAARLAEQGGGFVAGRHRARILAELLAHGEGLTGDSEDYDNPQNADFLSLISRRRGLPVTLSILYVALARRVGWAAAPLGVPGHVLVRLGGEADAQLLDPFDGGRLVDGARLATIVARTLGPDATVEREHLAPMGNRAVLVRMLSNQATRARRGGDVARALVLHERMTALAPGFSGLWWERARLEQLQGRNAAARASLAAMAETTHDPAVRGRIRAALEALARSNS